MVKWLGLCAFIEETQVESLIGELRSYNMHGVAKKKANELIYKVKTDLHSVQTYSYQKRGWINWEFGISRYKLLHIRR